MELSEALDRLRGALPPVEIDRGSVSVPTEALRVVVNSPGLPRPVPARPAGEPAAGVLCPACGRTTDDNGGCGCVEASRWADDVPEPA